MSKKYLGLDFGDTRIGLALGQENSIAVPMKILLYNDKSFWSDLQTIIDSENIDAIVVGWPLSLSGKENERTQKTAEFIEKLESKIQRPVYKEDERLSTKVAGVAHNKKRLDALAASEILQTFLARNEKLHTTAGADN